MTDQPIAAHLGPVVQALVGEDVPLRFEFWDGSSVGDDDAKATMRFNSAEAVRHMVWAPGELGFSRAYVTGAIDFVGDGYYALLCIANLETRISTLGVHKLVDFVKLAKDAGVLKGKPERPAEESAPKGRIHTKTRDKQAISHHYDVGNDFYRLVLGPSMTYSCARFVETGDSLEQAQSAKYDLVVRKLGLRAGMRLLDVGCGWGGMVLHAAQHYDVSAVGITLSEEQAKKARERISEAGLEDMIEIRVQDYRDLRGESFDAISSIGMFEHVGQEGMTEYFSNLYEVLHPGGRLLNHAISKPHGAKMARNGFIARYVFPDGELQDVSVSSAAMQEAGFELRDVESLREHYALTLRAWVTNLESEWDRAVQMVGVNRARVWWVYMVGSAIAFETGRISIHQTLGVKAFPDGRSGMPMTRRSYA